MQATAPPIVKPVGRSIATGALWMIGLKLIERSIGFISTVALARLLVPADFGLVAMAMAVLAILELAGQFGFDHAIIREPHAERRHFDTAWTLTVVHGLVSGALLAALAGPLAAFFAEPRLREVIYALAAIAALQGFENIGIVMFRKEMQFRKDFTFFLAKKLIAFVATVSLAVAFRNYWALVAGIAVSRLGGVVFSFVWHPYRPRLCLAGTRELFGFSRWVLVTGLLGYVNSRGPDYLIGRLAGAGSLGIFRISSELSNLPTTELMQPIMRAAYPGYAKVANDRGQLKATFLSVQGAVLLLTLPTAGGLIMLADPFVRLLLGDKWLQCIPLVQVLGVYGAIKVFQVTNNSIFNVLGKPYVNTALVALEACIALPLLGWLIHVGHAMPVASAAYIAALAAVVPTAMVLISRHLGVTAGDRLRVSWRPMAAALVMGVVLQGLLTALGPLSGTRDAVLAMSLLVPCGALVYVGSVLALWRAAGAPPGAERQLLDMVAERLKARRQG